VFIIYIYKENVWGPLIKKSLLYLSIKKIKKIEDLELGLIIYSNIMGAKNLANTRYR